MIWYFAYGSNLNQARFRSRVGDWQEVRRAVLEGHELRFSGEVESEGGGGAIVQPAKGRQVFGGVYGITDEQLAAMDAVELHGPMNFDGRGVRSTVELLSDGDIIEGELYEVPAPSVYRAPSAKYLGLITSGLRDFGYPEEVIAAVQAAAAAEPDPLQ
jgi:cation transport regulator ChaC